MFTSIDVYLTYLEIEKNCSDLTIDSYSRDLRDLADFFCGKFEESDFEYVLSFDVPNEGVKPDEVNLSDLKEYIAFLFDQGLEASSIQRKISSIRSFFKFLYNREYISNNPAYSLSRPKGKKRIPTFLTLKQINEMINFPISSFIDLRDRALLELFYSAGCRTSEIRTAQLKNLDLKERTLKVRGKGGTDRIAFLGESAVYFVNRYLKERRKKFGPLKGVIFINSQGKPLSRRGIFYIVKKRAKAAGFSDNVSPHTLRHSFATELMEKGADIRIVQELLGHKNLSTTQIYTHMSKSRLKKVYDECHPHA